ncbi:hypothetical protein PybrP1_004685 [[Pythium] brassicae (nom. inval.)]|nr:hypothetical protein PybrP1_004685 [[Pythium] brassicae (nom. inval.)]
MALAKVLYRELLIAARQFDERPALRALLSSNLMQRPVAPASRARLPHVERFNQAVLVFLENRSFYMPSSSKPSLAQLVRETFRANDTTSPAAAIDAAFLALRALNDKLADAASVGVVDAVTASAVSAPAVGGEVPITIAGVNHADGVAAGLFLVSHPLLSGLFSRSVIVLTEHSQRGSRGFIVNQPTTDTLMKAFKVHPMILRPFGSSKVRTGGPVRTKHAEVLHSKPEFGGKRIRASDFEELVDRQLFVGVDLEIAAKAVDEALLKPSELMFLNGVSTWTPGQLESELRRGTWVAVKAPLSLAVNPRKELWRDLMHSLGGEYQEFSAMPVIKEDGFDDDESDDDAGSETDESDGEFDDVGDPDDHDDDE